MSLFKRKAQPEPEPTLEQRLAAAEYAVEQANALLEALQAELAEQQRRFSLVLGPGMITHCAVQTPEQRTMLERWAQDFTRRRYRAEQAFYACLRVWSGLKFAVGGN